MWLLACSQLAALRFALPVLGLHEAASFYQCALLASAFTRAAPKVTALAVEQNIPGPSLLEELPLPVVSTHLCQSWPVMMRIFLSVTLPASCCHIYKKVLHAKGHIACLCGGQAWVN